MSTKAVSKPRSNKTAIEIEKILNQKIYKDISVLGGVAILGGGMIAFKFLEKRISEWFRDKSQDPYQDIDVSKLTYDAVHYTLMADQIYAALKDQRSDGKDVYPVIKKLYTDEDVVMLIKAFGVRCNKSYAPFNMWCDYRENLPYWLYDELKGSEKEYIRNTLSSRGITVDLVLNR